MSADDQSTTTRVARLAECDEVGIGDSAAVLKAGGLVAFPTETVYGLGANALNDLSVKAIFAAKKRPSTDPLIVHILSKADIYSLYDFEGLVSDPKVGISKAQLLCEFLADTFWPGPLTIIFKAKKTVPLSVTAGSGFVGLRSPRHPIARLLLKASGLPIAAPSANRFGHVSPTSAEHVMQDLGGEVITVLKDDIPLSGGCAVGIESTVCRVSREGDIVSILRCGAVTSEDISAALLSLKGSQLSDVVVVIENEKALIKKENSPSDGGHGCSVISSAHESNGTESADEFHADPAVAPGQMIKHYAPDIPTYIVTAAVRSSSSTSSILRLRDSQDISSTCNININQAFVIDFGGQLQHMKEKSSCYYDLSPEGRAEEACHRIFEVLRLAEDPELAIPKGTERKEGVNVVLLPDLRVEAEKNEMIRALWERLHRAASGTFVHH